MLFDHMWGQGEAAQVLGLLQDWVPAGARSHAQTEFLMLAAEQLGGERALRPSWSALPPEARAAAFRCLTALACFADSVNEENLSALQTVNREQRVGSPWPPILAHARAGRRVRATLAMGQLAPDGKSMLRQTWKSDGILGLLKTAALPLGLQLADARLAQRYASLEQSADGTLGRAFHAHMTARSLPLPGQRGGLPERALQHDLMHVVTGFDTDALGESRLAGFYAGVSSKFPIAGADPFTFVMVALLTFHLGYRVGPGFVATARGVVSPRELWQCYALGKQALRSPLDNWDFGAEVQLPLAEVRARFGLPQSAITF
jgi:hypothetical protein